MTAPALLAHAARLCRRPRPPWRGTCRATATLLRHCMPPRRSTRPCRRRRWSPAAGALAPTRTTPPLFWTRVDPCSARLPHASAFTPGLSLLATTGPSPTVPTVVCVYVGAAAAGSSSRRCSTGTWPAASQSSSLSSPAHTTQALGHISHSTPPCRSAVRGRPPTRPAGRRAQSAAGSS